MTDWLRHMLLTRWWRLVFAIALSISAETGHLAKLAQDKLKELQAENT